MLKRGDAVFWGDAHWVVYAVRANGKVDLVELELHEDQRRRGSSGHQRGVLNVPRRDVDRVLLTDLDEVVRKALDIPHPRPPEPGLRPQPWNRGKAGRPRKTKEAS